MNNMVSIIVPVYNMEKYLRKCIESLVQQTYKNIEIILVDDGSGDASGKICDEYAQSKNYITVIHKQNEGLGYARNTGMKAAKGDFIAFFDSDDYADSDMIEQLMRPIIEEKADTCIGGYNRVDSEGNVVSTEKYTPRNFVGKEVYNECYIRMLGSLPKEHDVIKMSVWNVIYSADIIRTHKIWFPSERELISEDLVFNFEYFKYAKKVSLIESVAYKYRITPTSLTNTYKTDKIIRICDFYEEMELRVRKEFENPDSAIIRLQKQFFVSVRGCVSQEKQKESHKNFKDMKLAMKNICENPTVQRVVNSYPVTKLHFKQRVFVFLLKHKMLWTLCLISNLGLV
ncbi:MAG: glycosyltransferase [Clostridium sp.]|nr:glycosyltransferase [Clostridium sp.]